MLAVNGEGDLRDEDPPGERVQPSGHPLTQGRMPGVHEPIEITASPMHHDLEPYIKGVGGADQSTEGDAVKEPALDPSDGR